MSDPGGGSGDRAHGALVRAAAHVEASLLPRLTRWTAESSAGEIVGTLAVLATFWFWQNVLDHTRVRLVIVGVVLLVAVVMLLSRQQRRRIVLTSSDFVQLDNSIFRLLVRFRPNDANRLQIKDILDQVLCDANTMLGDVVNARSMVLRPVGDRLQAIASYDMPSETLARRTFPLVPAAGAPRGVALAAYLDDEIHIATFHAVNGEMRTDHPDYHPGTGLGRYRSFIVVPLVSEPLRGLASGGGLESESRPSLNGDAVKLGVLCVNSKQADSFESKEMQEAMVLISQRLVAIISVTDPIERAG